MTQVIGRILVVYAVVEFLSILMYFPRLRLWFSGLRPQAHLYSEKKRRFAVLIPARNESAAISPLLSSVCAQRYPSELFRVFVIVKDPDDPTLKMVSEKLPLARTMVVPAQEKKADALDAAMKAILAVPEETFDAFLVVDADSVLAPDYLLEMNNAAESGADVIIPRKGCKNWLLGGKKHRSLVTNCSAMTYVAIDAMGNKGKCKKGDTLSLCGQGMFLRYEMIRALGGYPFCTLAEDYEIAAACIRNGYRQFYYEYAVVYSEEPVSRREYNKRRARWLRGFFEFHHYYGREMHDLIRGEKEKIFRNYFFLYGLLPLAPLFGASALAFLSLFVIGVAGHFSGAAFAGTALFFSLLPLLVIYLQLFLFGAFELLADWGISAMTGLEKVQFLLFSPFLNTEYAVLFFLTLFTRCYDTWEPIGRLDFREGTK